MLKLYCNVQCRPTKVLVNIVKYENRFFMLVMNNYVIINITKPLNSNFHIVLMLMFNGQGK